MDSLLWLFTVKLLHIHSMHQLDHRKVLQTRKFFHPRCCWSYLYSCYLFIEESICTLVVASSLWTSLNPPAFTMNSKDCLRCRVIHRRLLFWYWHTSFVKTDKKNMNKNCMLCCPSKPLLNLRSMWGKKRMYVQIGKPWLSCSSSSYE